MEHILWIFTILCLHSLAVESQRYGSNSMLEVISTGPVSTKSPFLLGLYNLLDGNMNNRPVYKRLGNPNDKVVYLNVDDRGFWKVSPSMDSEASYLITNTVPAAAKPPSNGWLYHDGNGWREDSELRVNRPAECCDELEIIGVTRNGAKDHQASLLGKYRLTTREYNGRFVYDQVNGDNILYYRSGVDSRSGWHVGSSYFEAGLRAAKSTACPLAATAWRYKRKGTNSWISDYNLKTNCSVKDFVCATTDSTEKGASPNMACRFPFLYRGEVYTTCTDVGNSDGRWCSTSSKMENGVYLDQSMWGYCSDNCPGEGSILLSRAGLTWIAIVIPILVVLIVIIIVVVYCVVKRRRNSKMMKLLDTKSTYSQREESRSAGTMREKSRDEKGASSRRDASL